MPGYGASTGESPLTYERIAARFVELLDHLQIDQADMVGLSFGGMHVLHTALNYPSRVGRLVLADTSPAFGMNGTDPEEWKATRTGALDSGADASVDGGACARFDCRHTFGCGDSGRSHRSIRPDLQSTVSAPQSTVCPTTTSGLDCMRLPRQALVIVGELDEETPVAYATVLHDGLANSTMVVLPGIGHLSPSEDPALFNSHVARFLAAS